MSEEQVETYLLTDTEKKEIDHWIAKYPEGQQRSAVMQALMIVQEAAPGRCLDAGRIQAVAEYLDLPAIAAQEVATFYSMYEHKPVGRYKIGLCTNISCKLRGSDEIEHHLEKKLGIGLGETTKDGKFTLKEVECLGACIGAPMCQINRDYHEHLTVEKLDKILDELE